MSPRLPWMVAFVLTVMTASSLFAKPDHVVLGYSASWFDDIAPPGDYAFDGLTHLCRSFLVEKADGSVGVPENYFEPQLETLAHQHGVKLLMSIGGAAENSGVWVTLASHPESLQRFVDTLERLRTEHHYDGVDVDWEPAPLTDAEGVAYVTLLKALRAKMPHAVITTALPAGEYWVSHMSWPDVIASVDYVNVMTYDYSGGWGGIAAHGSNLFPPGVYPPQPDYSVEQGMTNLLQNRKLPPEKLLMGVIFAGYRFRADKLGDHFPTGKRGYADNLTYARTLDLLNTGHYFAGWDEKAAMPYLQRDGGGDVVAYENPESMRRKCDYAKRLGIAGVMVWHVGMDITGRQAPLMDAVAQSFGVGPTVLETGTLARQITDVAADLKQHHHRDDATVMTPATQPSGEIDPAKLETTLAGLRGRWGGVDEQRWQHELPQPGAKPAGN